MLEGLRDTVAAGLMSVAARLTTDNRHPGASRIASPTRTLAGVPINPDTAVQNAVVWACLRYLSQTPAVLPWPKSIADGPRRTSMRSSV